MQINRRRNVSVWNSCLCFRDRVKSHHYSHYINSSTPLTPAITVYCKYDNENIREGVMCVCDSVPDLERLDQTAEDQHSDPLRKTRSVCAKLFSNNLWPLTHSLAPPLLLPQPLPSRSAPLYPKRERLHSAPYDPDTNLFVAKHFSNRLWRWDRSHTALQLSTHTPLFYF